MLRDGGEIECHAVFYAKRDLLSPTRRASADRTQGSAHKVTAWKTVLRL